ncbi:uncharacterized protein RJT20DRAFT_127210 [Scheffersomyces xylosifermentans]|uniref:uncharacterized protein n=1 Tax=Scheffersomyces xylosifermentans TaxID=1304137 RepID=UPI00315DF28E
MISLKGLLIILSVPFKVLLLILKYPLFGGRCRKLKNRLADSIRLTICYTGLTVPVRDCTYLNLMSNRFLIKRLLGFLHKKITSKLPHYGESYDKNSLWLVKHEDRKPSDPILFYLHGGGYYFETLPSQVQSVLSIYQLVDKEKRDKLSVLFLDYKLASNGYKLPYQLAQLHQTYTSLARDGNTNIIFMGDSAGGNLAVGYLQRLKELNDSTIPYPTKSILISPWVKILPEPHQYTKGKSYYDSKEHDMISYDVFLLDSHGPHIVGDVDTTRLDISPGNHHPYSKKDWEGIPTLKDPKSDVFVITGEDEAFRDDILEWAKYALDVPLYDEVKYGDSNNKFDSSKHAYIREANSNSAGVRVFVEPWGIHDSSLFFESHLIKKLQNNPNLKLKEIDNEEFFGITRIVEFLNDTL